jgi:hypothetical protein
MSADPTPAPADAMVIDYAESTQVHAWLRHPVLGDPSFDSFIRFPGNPIYRGQPPREWPVNGFLFEDPRGGGLFAYVGRYPRHYQFGPGHAPADCVVLRSRDGGRTWEEIGPVFAGNFAFAGDEGGANIAPDVSVFHADGRYHMAYDWVHDAATWDTVFTPGPGQDSGVGYAWADQPEGPFHRHSQPIFRNRDHHAPVPGKYLRLYAATLLRRRNDWLLLTLTDSSRHFAWGLYALMAASPEGPWSEPQLVLSLEGDTFHPALMEFFPAFRYDGFVYAPATSVALNRNFQCLWRAPLESAHASGAWALHRHGSLWHAENREEEFNGIWGQTFSGQVTGDNRLRVLFPSRDAAGAGTINLAECAWTGLLRDRGFVLNGCGGPSLTLLRRSFRTFKLSAVIELQGTARLLWGWHGVLGPDRHGSDANLHPQARRNCLAWEWQAGEWRILSVDAAGDESLVATGPWARADLREVELAVDDSGRTRISADGNELWSGQTCVTPGQIGLLAEAQTRLEVTRFALAGAGEPALARWHWWDAFLATGTRADEWETREDVGSPCGATAHHRIPGGRLKWNFFGTGVRWWAPRSPDQGRVRLSIDGQARGEIDLYSPTEMTSTSVFACDALTDGGHALVLEAVTGRLATGGLEVAGP